eukprot:SAG31_NODE_11776_length_999_cov_1.367778_1_plen_116_part_10
MKTLSPTFGEAAAEAQAPSFASLAFGSKKKKSDGTGTVTARTLGSKEDGAAAKKGTKGKQKKVQRRKEAATLAPTISAEVRAEVDGMSYRDMQQAAKSLGRTESGNHQKVPATGKA